jgi:hypothetical protein
MLAASLRLSVSRDPFNGIMAELATLRNTDTGTCSNRSAILVIGAAVGATTGAFDSFWSRRLKVALSCEKRVDFVLT